MVDVSDVTDPTLIAIFPYPEVPEDFPYKNFNDCGIGCPVPSARTIFTNLMTTLPWRTGTTGFTAAISMPA
jgi:hypothetical protein